MGHYHFVYEEILRHASARTRTANSDVALLCRNFWGMTRAFTGPMPSVKPSCSLQPAVAGWPDTTPTSRPPLPPRKDSVKSSRPTTRTTGLVGVLFTVRAGTQRWRRVCRKQIHGPSSAEACKRQSRCDCACHATVADFMSSIDCIVTVTQEVPETKSS